MLKRRALPTAVAALALAALPGAAHADNAALSKSPKVLTKDTRLKFGQAGVVTLEGWDARYKKRKSHVAVQVVKIEKGKASDIKGQGLGAGATGMVPWYIRAVLSYAGDDFMGAAPSLQGEYSDGSTATAVITSKNFGPCAYRADFELSKKKKSAPDCSVVLAPRGVPVVAVYTFLLTDKNRSIHVTWKK